MLHRAAQWVDFTREHLNLCAIANEKVHWIFSHRNPTSKGILMKKISPQEQQQLAFVLGIASKVG
jgi:hypothetical protein